MEVKSEVKADVKPGVKPKKTKTKLILSNSDEDSSDTSEDLSTKRQEELKWRLAETRIHAIQNCRFNNNEVTEDVFSDNISVSQPKNKNKEEMNEIMSLLDDLNQRPNNSVNNVDNNSLIVESDEEIADCGLNVSSNTRSKRGGKGQNKAPKKAPKKKTTRRKSGKKSQEFDEQKAFERLDGMQAMDDIEVVEDINTSFNVSQEIEEYIKDRDIEIKVKYKAVIEKFVIKSTEKFSKLMPIIAKKFNENVSELIFDLNEQIIDSEFTSQSIGLTISDIIVCRKRVTNKSVNDLSKDPNLLSLKLKDKTMKSGETVNVNKFDKIQTLVDWFSKFKSLPPNKFRLKFDDEKLDPNSTVAECDIEDESQIDVILL